MCGKVTAALVESRGGPKLGFPSSGAGPFSKHCRALSEGIPQASHYSLEL